jgi:hypothetical protein
MTPSREALERRWLALVRRDLPAAARDRGWPVRLDHCFARVLLDAVCGAPWREVVPPPAYRNLPEARLAAAVDLAERVLGGGADLSALNERSLALRRAARGRPGASPAAPEACRPAGARATSRGPPRRRVPPP